MALRQYICTHANTYNFTNVSSITMATDSKSHARRAISQLKRNTCTYELVKISLVQYPECFLKMAAAIWKTVWKLSPTFLVQYCQNHMIQSHDQLTYLYIYIAMRSAADLTLIKSQALSLAWS